MHNYAGRQWCFSAAAYCLRADECEPPQTKDSTDSLIVNNLLKSLNNPAVQAVVAVSDATENETIKKPRVGVAGLGDKLKCWDSQQVLQLHESLAQVNEAINNLGFVPQRF